MLEQLARKTKAECVTVIRRREDIILEDVGEGVISEEEGRAALSKLYADLEWLNSKDPLTEADTIWNWLDDNLAIHRLAPFIGGMLGEWSRFNALPTQEKETRKRVRMLETLKDAAQELAISDIETAIALYRECGVLEVTDITAAASQLKYVAELDPFVEESAIIRNALMVLTDRNSSCAARVEQLLDHLQKV